MKPLRIEDEAEAEFKAATDYYEDKRAGLGLAFEEKIREAFQRIQRNPGLFPFYKKTPFQKCLVEQFPYLVFYRELEQHITIVAVAHGRRRPGYWRKRKPTTEN